MQKAALFFLVFAIGIFSFVSLCTPRPAAAAQACAADGSYCRVAYTKSITPIMQQTPVWCWAASLSALFEAFGHPVDQKRIVARYFPPPGVTTGPPWVMINALNTTWVDDTGIQFTVNSLITNKYNGMGPFQVSNASIVQALANEVPVFYGDSSHAMIIVQIDYKSTPMGPNILAGGAIDPYPFNLWPNCPVDGAPCQGPGFRHLQPNELLGMFAAIPNIH